MDDPNRLDRVRVILLQPRFDAGGPDAAAPVPIQDFRFKAKAAGELAP